ncbi:MAG: FliO/MopB family protein [Acidobacteria bacterium]|nr:FliO/MopB family protein [Acidobacteriota bacterium]
MGRAFVLSLGMLAGLALWGQSPPPAPTPAEKELQSPITLEDGKPTLPPEGPSALRAFGSLVLVLGVAGAGLWALRRWGLKRIPGSGGGRLKVEESLALGDRRFVSILRAEEERFLIALSPAGITLLARLEGPHAESAVFAEALSREQAVQVQGPVREVEAMLRGEP